MKGFVNIQNDIIEAKEMLRHVEDEYRKANISEKDYKAMKEKYSSGNAMGKKDAPKEEEIKEITPEVIEKLASQLNDQSSAQEAQHQTKEKKPGIFSKLFKKKPEAAPAAAEAAVAPTTETVEAPAMEQEEEAVRPMSETEKKVDGMEVEIEKLKTILDTVRETGHVTDETIQTMSESIGELRSLVFQTDASLKETMVKMEKIEDDISQVKPKEIDKKFREIDAEKDRNNIEMEKFRTKVEDSGEKLNRMYEMLKSIGGIENLVDINKKIQEKLKEVEEAVKYIGRIGAKTEKQFMDLSKGMDDLVLFKARQEDLDESLKDILKSIDALNVKFEGYVSKSDLDAFREEMFSVQKQLENVDKVLPMVNEKLPEDIINLRKEREDIQMLLESLQEQFQNKKISKAEYYSFKENNEKRVKEIEKELEREWKKYDKSKKPDKPVEQPVQPATPLPEAKAEPPPAMEDAKKMQEVKEKLDDVKQVFEKKDGGEEEEKQAVPEKPKEKVKAEKKAEEKAQKKIKGDEKPKHKAKKHKQADTGRMRILRNIKKMNS
jgi:hypothetical protein